MGSADAVRQGERLPQRVDTQLADGLTADQVQRWVQSAAMLHTNGDGLDIAVRDGRIVGVRGRAVDRVNHGRLDVKDLFGWQANSSRDRLTTPLIRRNGELVQTDWNTAMNRIVAQSGTLLAERGPGSIGFYTSGQLVHRGVLHPGGDRPRRHRHQPRRRQYPAVHCHGRRGAQGILRLRRLTWLLY